MCMINGELGLKEITEYVENRMLNFWCNVATGEENKISTVIYKWIKLYLTKIYSNQIGLTKLRHHWTAWDTHTY